MLFSFIIPVYNAQRYLRQCLDSVLCQTGADFEVLLLDDGSTDGSGAICDEYAERYPNTVRVIHQENKGSFWTRRRGYREANGEWILCVDADDMLTPSFLKTIYDTVMSQQCDMMMFDFSYYDENGETSPSRLRLKTGIYVGEKKQELYRLRLLTTDLNMLWSKAVHRSLIDSDDDYRTLGIRTMCDDAVQVLPFFTNARRIFYLDEPLYLYRKGHDSITNRRTADHWNAIRECSLITERYMKRWQVSSAVETRYYTNELAVICNYVRWLMAPDNGLSSVQAECCFNELAEDGWFTVAKQRYARKLLSTPYLRISVPIISRCIEKKQCSRVRCFLSLENKLRRQ